MPPPRKDSTPVDHTGSAALAPAQAPREALLRAVLGQNPTPEQLATAALEECETTPLLVDHGFIDTHPAQVYSALMACFGGQPNTYSCSAQSVAAIVNAIPRAGRSIDKREKHVTVADLVEAVPTHQ